MVAPAPIRRTDARRTTTAALLAALLAASVLVTIPIGTVPLTLQVFVVVLIALLVSPGWAALAVGAYLVLGAIGLPVFSGFRGGLAVVLGPTGGYLIGFLAGAVAGAWVRERARRRGSSRLAADAMAAATVVLVVYLFGWAQLAVVTRMGAFAASLAGVVPFIVPDALKAAAAVAVIPMVRRAARR
jgi:biotin transport system substrate-specific component